MQRLQNISRTEDEADALPCNFLILNVFKDNDSFAIEFVKLTIIWKIEVRLLWSIPCMHTACLFFHGAIHPKYEVVFPRRPLTIKLFYPAANPSHLWRSKAFLFSDLAVGSIRQIRKKCFFNVREGSNYPAAWLTWSWHVKLHLSQLITARWINVICTAAGWIVHYPFDCRVNKCLFTRQPGKYALVISIIHPGAAYNKHYSPGRRVNSLGL